MSSFFFFFALPLRIQLAVEFPVERHVLKTILIGPFNNKIMKA